MLCANPYIGSAGLAFGCGQCLPCRVNRSRLWTHRILLEAAQYSDNAFLTLTYDEEKLPPGGTLVPGDLKAFLKRLRFRVAPDRFRFFAVGEYGDLGFRPHYHAALFGFKSCRYGISRYAERRRNCCVSCDLVRDVWGHGLVELGTLEPKSARYISGYVTKKMTGKDDARLAGRSPEFARMSLRPGIGASAMWEVASQVMRYDLDVPRALRHGRKELPLGRYLRTKVREMVGDLEKGKQSEFDAMAQEMLELRLDARASADDPSLKARVMRKQEGRLRNFHARQRIYKGRRKL